MATVKTLEFLLSELPGSAKFKVDDIEYIYTIKYNSRADFVVLQVSDEETGSILFTRKLSVGTDLLAFSKRGTVEGQKINIEIDSSLFAFDNDGVNYKITIDDFYAANQGVKLHYV